MPFLFKIYDQLSLCQQQLQQVQNPTGRGVTVSIRGLCGFMAIMSSLLKLKWLFISSEFRTSSAEICSIASCKF
jgi:hypothetical protein